MPKLAVAFAEIQGMIAEAEYTFLVALSLSTVRAGGFLTETHERFRSLL
jgi:hypothetical protein